MTDRSVEHWYPTAAYLYVLHQGGPALAWEYLRRNPDYRRDWLHRRRRPDTAHRWGLRLLEDPALDARDAHPAWFPDHDGVIQLYPDDDPPPDADAFEFWNVPGRKHLIHDGKRLMLTAQWPGCCVRLTLTPSMADGMAYLYAIRGCTTPCARYRALAAGLDALSTATGPRLRRPARGPRTPQCWNCTPAGTRRDPGGRVRARLPRGCSALMPSRPIGTKTAPCVPACAVRRGDALMRGGYRRLAQLPPFPSH